MMKHRILYMLITALALVLSPGGGSIVCAQGNLNIAILGDSNTWLGGDACNKEKGWTKWFCDIIKPQTCVSYARSGATWTNSEKTQKDLIEDVGVISDNNVIMNQMLRLISAVDNGESKTPDIIIIAAGTNDAWFNDKRPKAFNEDKKRYTSIEGAVTLCCMALKLRFPDAKILLLTPLQSTAVATSKINKAGDIIEACGKEMGAMVIRQDKVMKVQSASEKRKKQYTYDGTHTSVKGAKSNGEYIARWLKMRL